ncbi:TetR/AcrR family transcriptional regulator [Cohnella terricola]|uniref:TetR/AcrR family transcriptional regulator n=1 Tax=Cohnella terricola TaxID=1289167 RepID=A0A559JWC2_9BACL|nr:TetR/AcrR family transcriptional regulator [Cohnella terricola]TVY04192.1 TetR/AcrR family transcriptional regulator [Cohnella terricola]
MKTSNEQRADTVHDERRSQIKKAALKVFALRGLANTKMSMIAEEAGVSQGLSYRYFESKEELFTLLVQEALEEAQAAIQNIRSLSVSPTEQIKGLTLRMLDDSHKHFFMLLQHAQSTDDIPLKAKQMLERYSPNETIEYLVPIFRKGQENGEFCEGDPFRMLFLYFSVVTGLMLQDFQTPPGYWLQDVDRLMKIIVK